MRVSSSINRLCFTSSCRSESATASKPMFNSRARRVRTPVLTKCSPAGYETGMVERRFCCFIRSSKGEDGALVERQGHYLFVLALTGRNWRLHPTVRRHPPRCAQVSRLSDSLCADWRRRRRHGAAGGCGTTDPRFEHCDPKRLHGSYQLVIHRIVFVSSDNGAARTGEL